MKLVECKAELIQQGGSLDDLFKHIEACGRVPYKSEAKSDGTIECAKAFVEKMVKSNHLAVLEHGTVYLQASRGGGFSDSDFFKVELSPYSRNDYINNVAFVTTNLRVIVELLPNTYQEFLDKYMCSPTIHHAKRYTFRVLTSIGVTREINRHRTLSILEMSTRYCNFSRDKFDNQISFCKPSWLKLNTGIYRIGENNNELCVIGDGYIKETADIDTDNIFLKSCLKAEAEYMYFINERWPAQRAREILPLCTATEAVYTGFVDQWAHFFNLRYFETTGKVHPNMLELSTKMKESAEKANIWEGISKYINKENLNNEQQEEK